ASGKKQRGGGVGAGGEPPAANVGTTAAIGFLSSKLRRPKKRPSASNASGGGVGGGVAHRSQAAALRPPAAATTAPRQQQVPPPPPPPPHEQVRGASTAAAAHGLSNAPGNTRPQYRAGPQRPAAAATAAVAPAAVAGSGTNHSTSRGATQAGDRRMASQAQQQQQGQRQQQAIPASAARDYAESAGPTCPVFSMREALPLRAPARPPAASTTAGVQMKPSSQPRFAQVSPGQQVSAAPTFSAGGHVGGAHQSLSSAAGRQNQVGPQGATQAAATPASAAGFPAVPASSAGVGARPGNAPPVCSAAAASNPGGRSNGPTGSGSAGVRSLSRNADGLPLTPAMRNETLGRRTVEPWNEVLGNKGGSVDRGGGGGDGVDDGVEVADAWDASLPRVLGDDDRAGAKYRVTKKATAQTGEETVVLLLEESEGTPTPLVGVEFSTLRLSVSFDKREDAILMVSSILYLQPLKFRVLSPNPPYTRGHTSLVPAPFVMDAFQGGPFVEAGLEGGDLVLSINGTRLGDDGDAGGSSGGGRKRRWWEAPTAAADGTVESPGGTALQQRVGCGRVGTTGGGGGGGGGGSPAMSPTGRAGSDKENNLDGLSRPRSASESLELPFVELVIYRATGETSNTVQLSGSVEAQRAWVAMRLLQQQQTLVTAQLLPQFVAASPLSKEILARKNQALARSLQGDAPEVCAKLERSMLPALVEKKGPPTATAAKIKASVAGLVLEAPGGRRGRIVTASNGSTRSSLTSATAASAAGARGDKTAQPLAAAAVAALPPRSGRAPPKRDDPAAVAGTSVSTASTAVASTVGGSTDRSAAAAVAAAAALAPGVDLVQRPLPPQRTGVAARLLPAGGPGLGGPEGSPGVVVGGMRREGLKEEGE
ncbi:unnamed protein product, partial [Scytosiphon promiscuus]